MGKSKQAAGYAELVTLAEAAVVNLKNAELKRVAFEKILDSLLAAPSKVYGAGGPTGNARRRPAPSSIATSRPRSRSAARQAKRGPKAHIRELADEGFFKKQKSIAEVKAELSNRGHHIALTSLSGPLQTLCQEKVLRRGKGKNGKKTAFLYSDW